MKSIGRRNSRPLLLSWPKQMNVNPPGSFSFFLVKMNQALISFVVACMKAKCPICACEIHEPPVICNRCGVEYHADCWDYNEGCAIYGCLPVMTDQAGFHTPIVMRRASRFWVRNGAIFSVALFSPAGFISYDFSWSRSFPLPSGEILFFVMFVGLVGTAFAHSMEGWREDGREQFVAGRIVISTIMLILSFPLWIAFVVLNFLAAIRAYISCFDTPSNCKQMCINDKHLLCKR